MRDTVELAVLMLVAAMLVHATMGAVYYGLLLAMRGQELWGIGLVAATCWTGLALTTYMIRPS